MTADIGNCSQCIVGKQSCISALSANELEVVERNRVSFSLSKGETVFAEGDNMNGIFCLKQGVCKMTRLSSNGNSHVVKLSAAGTLLGQRSVLSQEPAGLSAVAVSDVQLCFIPKENVLDFFNSNNRFSLGVMKALCDDLKQANSHLADMAQKSVKQRLAGTLVYLHDTFGIDGEGFLALKLLREELAGIVGTATESCIRLLCELQKEGIVKLLGKNITIVNINSLRKLSES